MTQNTTDAFWGADLDNLGGITRDNIPETVPHNVGPTVTANPTIPKDMSGESLIHCETRAAECKVLSYAKHDRAAHSAWYEANKHLLDTGWEILNHVTSCDRWTYTYIKVS
ncbi:hypothetical protein [Neptuniibacter sp. QD37_11]|uniref:hypothetical protein n=1 Tax=Neptuniibacter sp. QD37_11 TaxID=3398209 RepID=UPI0039F496C9